MMMRIIYTRADDGGVSILIPASGARLVRAITVDDARIALAPTPFDRLVAVHKTDQISPEWAETEAEFCERIKAKDVPADALDVRLVDEAQIPADRTYRNAWRASAAGVEVDMERARNLHRQHIRLLRAPRLAELDVAYMRALEAGDAPLQSAIVAQKQALRDAPATAAIAAAQTPEELKAATPEALLRSD